MRTDRSLSIAIATLTLASMASSAFAQGTPVIGGAEPPPLAPDGTEQSSTTAAWVRGRVRPFVATTVELGWLYARPRIALGYGRPHFFWGGVETATTATTSYGAQYAGIRAQIPFVDFRAGARYTLAFSRGFLPVQPSYNRFDVDVISNTGGARYLSLESEVAASIPIPSGSVFAIGTLYGYPGGSPDRVFFEESLHVIVSGSLLWRGRVGYLLALGQTGAVRIGPTVELMGVPERGALIVRAGIVASIVLTRTIEILASIVPQVYGPDSLGLLGGDFSQLGLRWNWSSGLAPGYRSVLGRDL